MAKVTYEILDQDILSIPSIERYSDKDLNLIENFPVNKNFNYNKHYIETHFYSVNNVRLLSAYDYTLPLPQGVNTSTAEEEVTEVTIDPAKLAVEYGFARSDVKLVFHFLNDLYGRGSKAQLYIQDISKDRTELLLYTDKLSVNQVVNKTDELKERLSANNYFEEYWLNLGENDLYIVTNIDTWELDNKVTIAIKLYEPLPEKYTVKDIVQLVDKVADSQAFKVETEIEPESVEGPKLRSANFAVELEEDSSEPTKYFNFDDLFSYSNTNSNRELYNVIKDKSINLGVKYNNFDNFINFSSAEERLKNFKYKVQLIETYQADLDSEQALLNQTATGTSGSISATENLIEGLVGNFDHYERHLYFESGSSSWPKSNSSKPFVNRRIAHIEATAWYEDELAKASIYDSSNYDVLTNFLPEYLKDDNSNNNGILFTHMIGQHFDNLWIYTKAITDKYDTDNRLNFGISKDLVQEAVKSFGVKIYNSVEGSNDLFKYFIGDTYNSGSEGEVIDVLVPPYSKAVKAKANMLFNNLAFLINTGTSNFTLTSAEGRVRTYRATSTSGLTQTLASNGDILFFTGPANQVHSAAERRTQIKQAIESDIGHGGEIEVIETTTTSTLAAFTLQQRIPGSIGNIAITYGSNSGPTSFITAKPSFFTFGESSTHNPLSSKDYEAQVYKRLYHNIPLLTKSKGTERGLRALINCFGIPKDFLTIRTFGGKENSGSGVRAYLGTEDSSIAQIDKIASGDFEDGTPTTYYLDPKNDGKVLSLSNSIQLERRYISPDSHRLEVGFSPSNQFNTYIKTFLNTSTNIDDHIGDPRDLNKEEYTSTGQYYQSTLEQLSESAFANFNAGGKRYDLKDFVRSLKFYDNVLFKMIKDFIPVRATSDVGIIIKPHVLERSKVKSPIVSGTDETLSGSMETAFVTGSDSGAYRNRVAVANKYLKGLDYNFSPGTVGGASDLSFVINFSSETEQGDNGEIVPEGTRLLHPNGLEYSIDDWRTDVNPHVRKFIGTPYESQTTGSIEFKFYVMFSSESIDERFSGQLSTHGAAHHDHLIAVRYDENNGATGSWLAQANSLTDTASFDPLPNDCLLASFHQTGSRGIRREVHKFYTPMNGFVLNEPSAGSAIIPMKSGQGTSANVQGALIITAVDGTIQKFGATTNPSYNQANMGSNRLWYASDNAAVRALNLTNAINNFELAGKVRARVITTPFTSSVEITQVIAGKEGNTVLATVADAFSNNLYDVGAFPPSFIGGANKTKSYIPHNTTTAYTQQFKHLTGSAHKNIIDESPKITGELSGSHILISDGELNRANTFKEFIHPLTTFNITPVSQSVADVLQIMYMTDVVGPAGADVHNSKAAACSAFVSVADSQILYYGSAASNPTNGDTIYQDINGQAEFVGDGTSYYSWGLIQNGIPVTWTAKVSSLGVISDMSTCSSIDSTAPSGYTAKWGTTAITSGNVAAAPFSVSNSEVGTNMIATASDASGNEVYATLNNVASGFSSQFNATSLADGDDITLDVKLVDNAGNVGASATSTGQPGLVIPKQVAGPVINNMFIKVAETVFGGTTIPQTYNITARFAIEVHHDANFTGSISSIWTGSHAGSGQGTQTLANVGQTLFPNNGTSSLYIVDRQARNFTNIGSAGGSSQSGWNQSNHWELSGLGNTVTVSVVMTDTSNNQSSPATDTVPYYPHEFQHTEINAYTYLSNFNVSNSQGSLQTKMRSRGSAANWYVEEYDSAGSGTSTYTWFSVYKFGSMSNSGPFAGGQNLQLTFSYNGTGYDRSAYFRAYRTMDGFKYNLWGGAVGPVTQNATNTCVDPDTDILMGTGETKKIDKIEVGDVIRAYHETSHELLQDIVIRVKKHPESNLVRIKFTDGGFLVCSPAHRVYFDNAGEYTPVFKLVDGDLLSGKTVESIEELEDRGPVVEIETEKTHTYISNGISSHNNKQIT